MQVVGAALCALVGAWLVYSLVEDLRRQQVAKSRSGRSLALLDEQIAAARALRIRREQEHLHWNGYRKFRVQKKAIEADNIASFYLVPHDQKALPAFLPGQYLTFRFHVPSGQGDESKAVVRCYSLSDAPRDDYYRITVKRVPAPRQSEFPPGLISNYLHDKIAEGEIIDVQAPRGAFSLDPNGTSPVVLIGGGVGVTPLLSMVNAILESDSSRDVWMFYGVLCGREHAMKDHLKKLAERHENFHLHVCYSCPEDSDQSEIDFHRTGHISVDLLREVLKVTNYDFYVCGPPPMMNALIPAMKEWGVPKDRIHMEAFGPATVTKTASAKSVPAKIKGATKITIEFSRSGKTVDWNGEYDSLLDLALKHNVEINSGCRAGSCGSCEVAVKKGSVSYNVEPGAEIGDGSCLTCVSIPRGNLVLDA